MTTEGLTLVGVKMPITLRHQLDDIAGRTGLTISQLVCQAIGDLVEREDGTRKDRDTAILAYHEAGHTWAQTARRFGVSVATARRHAAAAKARNATTATSGQSDRKTEGGQA